MKLPCKIGIDAGGSKTELILVDATGAIVARHVAGGCNPNLAGPEAARATLHAALAALRASVGAPVVVAATHLYAAGSPAFWRETAAAWRDLGPVLTAPDSLPVLELATGGAPGLVLHAGTGSFIAARAPDGGIHYAGGLGWRFGDPGSGADLGRRGVARALWELQGWARRGALADALEAQTGLADYPALSRWFYTAPEAAAAIAGFAPRVIELAAAGNQPAQLALVESLTELVGQARLVTARLFPAGPVPCGVSGAVLTNAPAAHTLRALVATQDWPVTLRFIAEPPSEGVRRLLLKAAG